jgi:hypothetical protein
MLGISLGLMALGGEGGVSDAPDIWPTLTYRGHGESGVDGTAFTTGSIDIGAADATRYVIVCVYGPTTSDTTVTCSEASAEAFAELFTADFDRVKAFIAKVPAGTACTFTATHSVSEARHGITVYTVTNLGSVAVRDSATFALQAGGTLDVDVLEGGFVIGYGYATATPTVDWTGLTEDHETLTESAVDHFSASASNLPAAFPRAVSVEITSSAGASRGFAISMR